MRTLLVCMPRPSRVTHRVALGPHADREVFTLQTLPRCNEPFDSAVGKVTGFSLHAGVAARKDERKELDRLCRYTLGLLALPFTQVEVWTSKFR